ncbi:ubiquinol-cytochrome c reductase iron-sulfur subunit [Woeseiaceae bacterium]|jgi:ubiquinol-cytochrome c reductase iron-sulfur subunit|nr:ubiquinol-cytochrome c reductase iron-sulfur subunit [Woeseiaceae bacterium]MDB2544666.1 ubiquinol-cytochrome c reductase iron-sulfur subunit [Woeseiaceae bacterium]
MTEKVDQSKRHFLTIATAVTGGAGIAFAAVPFLSSLKPSARARALGAPVEVPLASLEPGEMIRVVWRGRLVYVLRRTEEMLGRLVGVTEYLRDPNSSNVELQPSYATNEHRSLNPEYLVVEGSCTHLGCAPLPQFEVTPSSDWFGGFFCPCHGSKFDLSGRVYKGVPAPTNLRVPPYTFSQTNVITIGIDSGSA